MKLTDKMKQDIMTAYAGGVSKSTIAKTFDISYKTVDRLIKSDEMSEIVKSVQQKKEAAAEDIFEYMDKQKERVCLIMNKYLDALADDDKISSATVNQLTTALGTLIDKWTMVREKDTNAEVRLAYIVEQDAPEAPPEEVEDESTDE